MVVNKAKYSHMIILVLFIFLTSAGLVTIFEKITKRWKSNKTETIQELSLTDNTILFTINLKDTTCYIAESKTNGYVDVEIDCK